RQSAQNFIKLIEFLIDPGDEHGRLFRILDQRSGGVAVARAQARTDGQGAGAIAYRRGCGTSQQLVSDLGHGADYDYRMPAHGYAPGYDGCGPIDCRRVFDRRAAEFHYNKAHAECLMLMS